MQAIGQYGRSDSDLRTIVEPLRDRWDEWAVIIVSDHSQETVTEPEPIDLHGPARRLGLEGVILDDGAAAVAGGSLARRTESMTAVPGVEGIQRIDGSTVLVGPLRGATSRPRRFPSEGSTEARNNTAGRRGHGRASSRSDAR